MVMDAFDMTKNTFREEVMGGQPNKHARFGYDLAARQIGRQEKLLFS